MQAAEDARDGEPGRADEEVIAGGIVSVGVWELVYDAAEGGFLFVKLEVHIADVVEDAVEGAVADLGRPADVLRLVEPEQEAEEGAGNVGDGGDFEWGRWQVQVDAGEGLDQEPQGLDQSDGFAEAVGSGVLLHKRCAFVNMSEQAATDDWFKVLHFQIRYFVVVGRAWVEVVATFLGAVDEASHIVVECLGHTPCARVAAVILTEFVYGSLYRSGLEELGHCDTHADFRGDCVDRGPAEAGPQPSPVAIGCFGDVEVERGCCAEENGDDAGLEYVPGAACWDLRFRYPSKVARMKRETSYQLWPRIPKLIIVGEGKRKG